MLNGWPDEPILLFNYQAVCSDIVDDHSDSSCAPFDCPDEPVTHVNPCTATCCTEGDNWPQAGDTCIVRAWTGQLGFCEHITNEGNTFGNDAIGLGSNPWHPQWDLGAWNICVSGQGGGQDPSNDNLWGPGACPTVEMELQGPTHVPGEGGDYMTCLSCAGTVPGGYDSSEYGYACCDAAWYENSFYTCAQLESVNGWDCSGCLCPGDGSAVSCAHGSCTNNNDCTGWWGMCDVEGTSLENSIPGCCVHTLGGGELPDPTIDEEGHADWDR
tara:strand:- start:456 stop:1268 length:813 start_codon:yes stop_codon:yes gene_type:complete